MAYPTVTVQGKIVGGGGTGVSGGLINFTLSEPGSVTDVTSDRMGGSFSASINDDGTVNFDIMANDQSIPSGTWRADFFPDNTPGWTEHWLIDSGGDNPIDIGNITRVLAPSTGPSSRTFIVSDEDNLPPPSAQYEGWLGLVVPGSSPSYYVTCLSDGTSYDWVLWAYG